MNSPTFGRVGAPMASMTKQLGKLVRAEVSQAVRQAQPKQPKAGKSRKGRSRQQAKRENAGVSFQGSKLSISREPLAEDFAFSNPTYLRMVGAISHKDFGNGIRMEGRQLLSDVTTTNADSSLFAGTGTATAITANAIQLSPDALNGRIALQARNWSRYAFRRVCVKYIPRVATSDVGQLAMAYIPDGLASSTLSTPSFATTTAVAPGMVVPFRKMAEFCITYTGDLTWFTKLDNATIAGSRATCQGEMVGFPDASSIGNIQHGWTWVEYVVDFYGEVSDYGFTFTAKTAEEKEAIELLLQKLRLKSRPEDWDRLSASSARGCTPTRRS